MSSSSVSEVSSHFFKFETTKEGLRKRQAELEKTEKKQEMFMTKNLEKKILRHLFLKNKWKIPITS
ncbi:MAG: hypothetical protein KR126chlam5_00277 [Candidatus Anoxychlamydiales bacterium]|nr:hypothetical protein [Candidatus Anoxychlamydiales bacterium]